MGPAPPTPRFLIHKKTAAKSLQPDPVLRHGRLHEAGPRPGRFSAFTRTSRV